MTEITPSIGLPGIDRPAPDFTEKNLASRILDSICWIKATLPPFEPNKPVTSLGG